MKPGKIFVFLFSLLFILLNFASCDSPTNDNDGGNSGGGGTLFDINTLSAGLYTGAPSSLTASSAPIADVAANDVGGAVTYAKAYSDEYTLLVDDDLNAGAQTLSVANVKLTIIGIGQERTIQFNGAASDYLFYLDSATASLSLGKNITLRCIQNSSNSLIRVENGSLAMLDGSKITGHSTSSSAGAVNILGNSSFTMDGGEITGNHTTTNTGTGGIFVQDNATFTMSGGSITGNTRGNPPEAMDVYLYGGGAIANGVKTGGTIGVSDPAGWGD